MGCGLFLPRKKFHSPSAAEGHKKTALSRGFILFRNPLAFGVN